MLCYVATCYTVLWCDMLCYVWCATLRHATLCCAMLHYAALCYATLYCAMLCYDMLCRAIACYAMLCYATSCYAVPCYSTQFRDMLRRAALCHVVLRDAMLRYALSCCAKLRCSVLLEMSALLLTLGAALADSSIIVRISFWFCYRFNWFKIAKKMQN